MVRRAAALAAVDEEIQAMPMGYETLVNTGGIGLSGGQRQRVTLARALVPIPGLMVVDEATSALDPRLERLIFTGLLQTDYTLVAVAHRLSAVVVVVDGGRFVQQGSPELLRSQPGPYTSLLAVDPREAGM